jgi:DNA invertase Pin-like site-specific DNA recombinase/transposase
MSKSINSRRVKEKTEMSRSLRRRVVDLDASPQADGNSWDKFSIFCAGPGAVIVAPPAPPPSLLRVAVYARFSTDAQKESSIRRQETNCATYYRTLGVKAHTLFADEGMSASTSVQRVSLQQLLVLCEQKLFDVIVVEDFDRWSRDLFDSIKIAERLESTGVQLHCAAVRRHLSLDDIVQLAMAAQHDKVRRRNLCMAGADQMVLEKGGMPWGPSFGYIAGKEPGFPEKHPEEAKAVNRAFELGLTFSAAVTARVLGEEGYVCPDGTLLWNASTVTAMWNCTTFAGLIRFRKTINRHDRATGKVTSKTRPAYEYVQAYNVNFQIVGKDLFLALQAAKRGRTRAKATGTPRKKGPVFLFGRAVCDCKGAVNQNFYPDARRYICSLYRDRRTCLAHVSHQFPIEVVDGAILTLVSAALTTRLDESKFRHEFLSALEKKAVLLNGRRRQIGLQLEKAEIDADHLLDPEFVRGASPERIQAKRHKAEEKVATLRSDLASVPKLDHLSVRYDEEMVHLRDAFDLVGDRLPFTPVSEDDHELIRLLRKLVKGVRVLRLGHLAGKMGIEVDLQWAALFLSADQVVACDFPIETLNTEVVLKSHCLAREGTRQHWESLVASGAYALTEPQWKLVEPHLVDTTKTDLGGKSKFTTRQIADALIFKMRSGVGMRSTSWFFGARDAMSNPMLRFIYSGGIETLVEVIGGTDPKWLEGLDVSSLKGQLRGTDKATFSRVSVRPERTAAACWAGKTFHLTDEQWDRIKGVIDPGIESPRHRARRRTSARRVLDGIFVKLRTGCAWRKMPPDYGGSELKLAAMAFAYLGSWDRLLEILQKDFPDVLDGLNTSKMASFRRKRTTKFVGEGAKRQASSRGGTSRVAAS